MDKEPMNKKGFFYTIGLAMFVLVLLSLSVLILRHANAAESRHIELSFAQRVYDTDISVQNIFADTFTSKTGMIFNSTLNTITIKEDLPQDFSTLNSLTSKFKTNVEKDFTNLVVDLGSYLTTHELIFAPSNITYTHLDSGIVNIPANSNITGYDIILTFSGNITTCDTTSTPSGSIDVNFVAFPSAGCNLNVLNVQDADIDLIVSGENVNLDISDNGVLTISTNATVESLITININTLQENGNFEMPIHIEINDSASKFYKKNRVKFPLLSEN
jgi:hypothetical protein